MKIEIEAPGLKDTLATIQAAARRVRELAPVLNVVAQQIATGIDDSFRSGTGFDGQPFARNAAGTIKKKKSTTPLVDTGRLRDSMSAHAVGQTGVAFGTNVSYAAAAIAGGGKHGVRKHTSYGLAPGRVKGIRGNAGRRSGPRQQFRAGEEYAPSVRNPLPVTMSGRWIDVARGSALRAKIVKTITTYVTTGRAG